MSFFSRRRWALPTLAASLLALLAFGYWLVGDLPAPTPQNLAAVRPSTLLYDRQGQLLFEAIGDQGKQRSLSFEQIPAACWQATVAVEDSRFFHHPGVDLLAIGRAAIQNLRSGTVVSGASTITQQLARNTLMSAEERYEQSLRRKLREAWLALLIELRYDKQEVLAMYLNQVYFGNFAYGLEGAAHSYFGKSAGELDLAECSLLAGLVQNPEVYNPIYNLESARWRQSNVLAAMVGNGTSSRGEAELALAERLQFAATPFPIEAPHFVSYVEAQLERLLGAERVSQGGLRVMTTLNLDWNRQAEAAVGYRLGQLAQAKDAPPDRRIENAAVVLLDPQSGAIRAMVGSPDYFDASIDGAMNAALALRQPGSALKPLTYAAAMDPARAAAAGREPFTAATVIADVRTAFLTAEGEPYVPQNYDMQWHGPVSVRTALASSYNLPAVKTLEAIGIPALIDQAQRQGITSFQPAGAQTPLGFDRPQTATQPAATQPTGFDTPQTATQPTATQPAGFDTPQTATQPAATQPTGFDTPQTATQPAATQPTGFDTPQRPAATQPAATQPAATQPAATQPAATQPAATQPAAAGNRQPYGLALTLGGGEVSLLELTAAYAAFANGGAKVTPYAIERIEDADGNLLWRANDVSRFTSPALDPRVAYLITDILSDDDARAPSFGRHSVLKLSRPAAVKTGTTTDWRDNWTVGYTPHLAGGVWVGNADNTPMAGVSGVSGAGPIWRDVMEMAHKGLPAARFRQPEGLVRAEICIDSGLLPTQWCSRQRSELFIAGTEPVTFDAVYQPLATDRCRGGLAGPETTAECIQQRVFRIYPPELREWALAQGIDERLTVNGERLTVTDERVTGDGAQGGLALISPDPNSVFRLSAEMPAGLQQVRLASRPLGAALPSQVTFLVDGQPVGQATRLPFEAWWTLQPGAHYITAVATAADGQQIASEGIWIKVE
jgi:membrane peptidoglycan carboxypeptidase